MSLASKLLSASGGGVDPLWVDDVFSAFTYTGVGGNQVIVNGVNLGAKGGMVWGKARSAVGPHFIYDTERSASIALSSASTAATSSVNADVMLFNSDGFRIPGDGSTTAAGTTFATWTFRKAPKFFDVVTYTGNGVAGRQIPHALGIAPGMVIVKSTSTVGQWATYHRSVGSTGALFLNGTGAVSTSISYWNNTNPSSSEFTLGNDGNTNQNGVTHVAYLFAHDTSADGIIQCGSYTGLLATVTLGWEPQFVLLKSTTVAGADWMMLDSLRGMTAGDGADAILRANVSSAEYSSANALTPSATGFKFNEPAVFFSGDLSNTGQTYIYLAIRRPNKPPTLGTQVYASTVGTYSMPQTVPVGFPPDLVLITRRTGASNYVVDRLRGQSYLMTSNTDVEASSTGYSYVAFDKQNDVVINNIFGGAYSGLNHFFKRAVGVFDQVCYTGTGVAKTEAHGLGVVPELMIVKSRNNAESWAVYSSTLGASSGLTLTNGANGAWVSAVVFNSTSPTSTVFSLGTYSFTNQSTYTYVAYLFASKAGIQKITSFVGNGSSQTIDCGFTTGARFVCIKATSTTGDWLVGDSTRGLVAGNDPRLSLNTTAAEVTTEDWLDPHSSGFIVNQVAGSNANVNGVTYLVWAIA